MLIWLVSWMSDFQLTEPVALPWLLTEGNVAGDLPDINVWLALAIEEHPHHAIATNYWQSLQVPGRPEKYLWFCRVTMLGLVRLLCQPKVVGNGALALGSAFKVYQRFRDLPGIGLLPDSERCDQTLKSLVDSDILSPLPPRLWTDAYLASLAASSGARLVSFDRDFLRFKLTKCLILNPS